MQQSINGNQTNISRSLRVEYAVDELALVSHLFISEIGIAHSSDGK